MALNKVLLIGYAGSDPDTKKFERGDQVSNFSLATSETFTRNNEKVTQTEWHRIIFWNDMSKVVDKYVKKGMHLYIEGTIRTRSYEKEGHTFYVTEVFGRSMQMLDKKPQSEKVEHPNEKTKSSEPVDHEDVPVDQNGNSTLNESDDLPF